MNDFTCLDCAHSFSEDQLHTVPGTFISGCPACHSENIKDAPLIEIARAKLESFEVAL